MALKDGVVAGWIGGTTTDITGRPNQLYNPDRVPTIVSGVNGGHAYYFNRPTQPEDLGGYLVASMTSDLQIGKENTTVAMWIKNLDYQQYNPIYISDTFGTNILNSDFGEEQDSGTYFNGLILANEITNSWHFFVMEITTDTITAYTDTIIQNSIEFTPVTYFEDEFLIGKRDDNPTTYNAGEFYLGDMYIWNRVLTTDEITTLYNSGNGLSYPFETATENTTNFFRLRKRR